MSAAQFKVYDAMLAMALSGTVNEYDGPMFYGRLTTLANHTGYCLNRVKQLVAELVQAGWVRVFEANRRRTSNEGKPGTFATTEYVMVTHESFAKENGCPPWKYDPQTGEHMSERDDIPRNFGARVEERQYAKEVREAYRDARRNQKLD